LSVASILFRSVGGLPTILQHADGLPAKLLFSLVSPQNKGNVSQCQLQHLNNRLD